jgi:hypothetical protein
MTKVTAILREQKRTLTVMTVKRARLLGLNPSRSFGYVIRIEPPIESITHGWDVEGIGWCPHPRRTEYQHFHGWYKFKSAAVQRIEEIAIME